MGAESLKKLARNLKDLTRDSVKSLFRLLGYDLVRQNPYEDYREYIPFHPTIEAARKSGLSVGDYIDVTCNVPGSTQDTIDQMKDLGVFNDPIDRICEIGPGTGRYLEKVLKIAQPTYCEIYETAKNWENWLVHQYRVVAQPSDGTSLAHTPSNSIDLVQAHKVMPGQPSLVMFSYFEEMARVARSGGKVVFDIVTEECMDDGTLDDWQKTGAGYQHYPALMCKQFTVDFFARRGLQFNGSFIVPMKPGKTECLVFTKL